MSTFPEMLLRGSMAVKEQGFRSGYKHDLEVVRGLYQALLASDVTFATYLPDTFNYPLVRCWRRTPRCFASAARARMKASQWPWARFSEGAGRCC
jgi:hypothetical protein